MKFRWAPAGSFVMGSPAEEAERRADEGPVRVTISRGFWVGQYEVTQGEWVRRMKAFSRVQDRGVGDRASKVGSYRANAWGIFDMHGNEWEWCRDWDHRRLPGGAWVEPGWANRSAMRLRYEPERRSDHIGFRVVAVTRVR